MDRMVMCHDVAWRGIVLNYFVELFIPDGVIYGSLQFFFLLLIMDLSTVSKGPQVNIEYDKYDKIKPKENKHERRNIKIDW